MSYFQSYLKYRLKDSILRTVAIYLISLLFSQTLIRDEMVYNNPTYWETGLYAVAIVLGALCALIPFLETACLKKRRNLDLFYSIPLSRNKLALAHYVSGWLQVMLIYSAVFLHAVLAWLHSAINMRDAAILSRLIYLLPYYLLSLCIGLLMYSFFIFLFGEGNTVGDGVAFSGLWIVAIYLIVCMLRSIPNTAWEKFPLTEWTTVYSPINNLTVLFQDLIHTASTHDSQYVARIVQTSYMYAVWVLIGVLCTVGYFYTATKKNAEKAGDISDSVFGYRLLIPLCGYIECFMFGFHYFLFPIVFVMMLIGFFIYRRGFKLQKNDIVTLCCGIIPLILNFIFK